MKGDWSALDLKEDEADILIAIHLSIEAKRQQGQKTAAKQWQQGGLLAVGSFVLGFSALRGLGIKIPNIGDSIISRNANGFTIISDFNAVEYDILEPKHQSVSHNPLQYRETYQLEKDGTNWKLTLLPQNSLHVHPETWKEMLKAAKEKLNGLHSDKGKKNQNGKKQSVHELDVFDYVPLLIDKKFAMLFEKKLAENPSPISDEQCRKLKDYILHCHGPRGEQPEHIRKVGDAVSKRVIDDNSARLSS